MKVVLATHSTDKWLGVNKYFYLLAKYIDADVTVIVDSQKGIESVREICGNKVNIIRLKPTATGGIKTIEYCTAISNYLMDHTDFDVLHCGHVLPFVYLLNKYRNPVVFQPFGNELFTLPPTLYRRMARPILRYCGNHADVTLAEGAFQHDDMRKYYPNAIIGNLPVGIEFNPVKREEHHGFQFIAVNSLLPYEGMDEVINAFKEVYSHYESNLVIVGTGSEEAKLRRLSEGYPIDFYSNISEGKLKDLYAVSDCFICTSHETDYQMGVLEGMANGLIVISRQMDWVPKYVLKFINTEELIKLMISTRELPPDVRDRIIDNSLNEVQQYRFENIAKKALKIYEELL